MTSLVDHPPHYGGADNLYEHVKVMEAKLTHEQFVGAMIFLITKYLDRLGKKAGAPAELDAAKAAWYSDRLTKYLVASKPREQAVAQGMTGMMPPSASTQGWVLTGNAPFDTDMRPNPPAAAEGDPWNAWSGKSPVEAPPSKSQSDVKGSHKK